MLELVQRFLDRLRRDVVADLCRVGQGAYQAVRHRDSLDRYRLGAQRRVAQRYQVDVVAAHHGQHSDLHLRLVADKGVTVHHCPHADLLRLDGEVFDLSDDDAGDTDGIAALDGRRIVGVEAHRLLRGGSDVNQRHCQSDDCGHHQRRDTPNELTAQEPQRLHSTTRWPLRRTSMGIGSSARPREHGTGVPTSAGDWMFSHTTGTRLNASMASLTFVNALSRAVSMSIPGLTPLLASRRMAALVNPGP